MQGEDTDPRFPEAAELLGDSPGCLGNDIHLYLNDSLQLMPAAEPPVCPSSVRKQDSRTGEEGDWTGTLNSRGSLMQALQFVVPG